MGFSNKKEDVIYMELTPYGRQLLSRGELSPAYYSFFDDDILYDIQSVSTSDTSNYSSGFLSESSGDTKERILQSTPYLTPHTSYVGRDKRAPSIQNYYLYKNLYRFEDDEKLNFLNYPIGTSDSHSRDEAPYWNIKYLHGTASSTEVTTGNWSLNTKKFLDSSNILSSSLPYKNIPQIHFNVDYELSIKNIYTDSDDLEQFDFVSPNLQLSTPAADGTYISLKEASLLLHLIEENGFKSGDSFNVEVLKQDKKNIHRYTPLKFSNNSYKFESQSIVNGFLVDTEGQDVYEQNSISLSPEYVEYYFDIRLDSEIPEEDICSGLQILKRKEIFIDLDVDCLERDEISDIDIYATNVTDIEEC